MATEWKSQQGGGKYAIQFETDNRELYFLVQEACRVAMDREQLIQLQKENRGLRMELTAARKAVNGVHERVNQCK